MKYTKRIYSESEVKQILEIFDIFDKQVIDKELKEIINDYKEMFLENQEELKEIERLKENNQAMQEEMASTWKKLDEKENIIKEVREYISNTKMFTYGEEKEFFLKDYWYGKELLEILDQENKE